MWAHVDGGSDDDVGGLICGWDVTLLFPGVCWTMKGSVASCRLYSYQISFS